MGDWFEGLKIPPQIAGMMLAMSVALVRVVYDQKEKRVFRIFLESMMCGGLYLTISYAIEATGLHISWSMFVAGTVGYLGSSFIRKLAMRLITREIDRK